MIKAKTIFTLIVGGAILFYTSFMQETLFKIGTANIFAQDLATIFIVLYLIFAVLNGKNRKQLHNLKSILFFVAFFIWGIIAIMRGFINYGFHTVGEARWYILVMLYYFFILFNFKRKEEVIKFSKTVFIFIFIMIVLHFIQFYFLGIVYERTGRSAFRFINATEALLVAFLLIWLFLIYTFKYKIHSKINFYLLSGTLVLTILFVQHRSVWLATLGGILTVLYVSKGRAFIRLTFPVFISVIFLIGAIPIISNLSGYNVTESVQKSTIFAEDPNYDATGKWRLLLWTQALEDIQKQPFIGKGLGAYNDWYLNGQLIRTMAHNGYLMNVTKFGLIGFVLLLSGIYNWFKEMNWYIKREKDKFLKLVARGLEIALVVHLIYVTFYDFSMFFWMILALGSVMAISSKNELKTDRKSLGYINV